MLARADIDTSSTDSPGGVAWFPDLGEELGSANGRILAPAVA